MDEISLENLKLLINYDDSKDHHLISEGNRLSFINEDEDDFDPINNLRSLEYPIYFTYNHLMNKISDNHSISYSQKKNLLNLINCSLDNLYDFIINFEDDNNENMIAIFNTISDRYDIVREKTVATRCEALYFLFDDVIQAFSEASRYLYFTTYGQRVLLYNTNDTDTDTDIDTDTDSDIDENKLERIDFEGVEYLEGDDREVYSTEQKLIGKWNDDCTDIIWMDDHDHENEKNKLIKLD